MSTVVSLLLDTAAWDLTTNTFGDIAINATPAAQDAACAIQEWLGEYYWDTTQGVPWKEKILGVTPPPSLALLKQILVDAAIASNPDIASAVVYISSFSSRAVSGQVQVISASTGQLTAANFTAANPQGEG